VSYPNEGYIHTTWTTTSARRARISVRKLLRSTARILPGVSDTSLSNALPRRPSLSQTLKRNDAIKQEIPTNKATIKELVSITCL